jgi:sporulation protein YlmC with PRC-barrel domain
MKHSRDLASDVVKTAEVIGIEVKNAKKESLGSVHEIVLDKRNGNVRYVVLSFGGFLGLGDKLFALPWNAISYDEDEQAFILNVDKDKLKDAPSFDKEKWPNMSDARWGEGIYNYYGSKANWL